MTAIAQTIKIEIPVEMIDDTEPTLSNIIGGLKNMGKEAENANKSVNKVKTSKMEQAFQKMKQWGTSKYQSVMEVKDRATPVLSKVVSGVKGFAGKTWTAAIRLKDMVTAPLKAVGRLLVNPVTGLAAAAGVGLGLSDTINTYSTFESTMSRVQALADANEDQMVRLTQKAKEMGAQTKFSGTESAEAFTYMAQAGWSVNDMISGISGVMSLAAADGLDLATTTDIVSNALTAFGLKASDSAHFADVLAVASSATNTDVYGLGEAFKYVAPVAGALKYNIEDVSMALGLMSNNGVKGSMAGTALKTSLANLASPTDNMAAAMQKYGISLTDSEGNMKSLRGVIENLRSSLGGLSEAEQTAAASTIFGKEAMAGMLAIINASDSDWNNLANQIDNSAGAADRMAETMQDNLAGALEQMGGAIETAQLTLGERLAPYIRDLAGFIEESMPAVEDGITQFMDAFDRRAEAVKEKISEFTASEEWQNADFFGKAKIAWDELIAEPFSEWWDSSGKASMAEKAAEIGHGIGSGISTGLLTLLGIDVGSGINEGAAIGKNFAQGFISGFDMGNLKTALGSATGGLFKNAAKILPGGHSPDLTSFASAALLAKVGLPLLSAGINTAKLGKTIFGSGTGGLGLGKAIIGSAAAGTGLKGLGATAGMFAINAGSTASSGAGLIAAGGAGITGGIAGGVTLISGGMDAYQAYQSHKAGDDDAALANGMSAATKVGGVAAGAAAGAAIGSVVPVIGTAIGALAGAGIGGIAGWIHGNSIKQDHQEKVEAAEAEALMAEKSKYALEGSRFESQELADSMKDSAVSAEEFGMMMEQAASQKIQDSFGDISLSMQEIKDAAKQIAFDGDDSKLTGYADAAAEAESSFASLQAASSNMAKLNWKAGLGMIDDESSVAEYRAGVETMITSAQQYVEDQHYQAKAAIDLLVEPGSPVDMTTGLNSFYADLQNQISDTSQQLTAKMNIALEDGVITMDEQAELSGLQEQLASITEQLSSAQAEASMDALKIKYSGAELDAGSFANLTSELQTQVQDSMGQYDDALEIALTNLNLQLESGAINQAQFDAQFQALTDGYQANIQDLAVNVESFQLDAIATAFGSELDGILPDLEGSVAERLGQAMHNAMEAGVDVEGWDVATASQWLDLDGLSAETQSAITEMMSMVAATMPDALVSAMDQTEGAGTAMQDMMTSSVENMDFSGVWTTMMDKMGEGMSEVDFSESGNGLSEGLQNTLTTSMENVDMSGVAESINSSLGEAMSTLEVSEDGGGLAEGIQNSLTTSMESIDMSGVAASINASLGEAMSSLEVSGDEGGGLSEGITNSIMASFENIDLSGVAEGLSVSLNEALASAEGMELSGFGESLSASIASSVAGMDFSAVTTAVGSGVSSAIEASLGTIQSAISSLYSQVGSAINSAFAAGFQTTTTVTITVDYQLANPSATISFSGGGTGTATVSASIHANGGFVYGPELSWIGEDGPEAVIPLGGKRRARGVELWEQVGNILGIPQHADGGIFAINGNASSASYFAPESEGEDEASESKVGVSINDAGGHNVQISVNMNPSFEISGDDPDTIMQMIKARFQELADDFCEAIGEQMSDNFSNMPI